MAGSRVPYQLRVNKNVDRNIFVELLFKIFLHQKANKIANYTYLGFGGYAFEDFKLLHLRLGISKMISLENDEGVFIRQGFNKPYSCIDLKNEYFGKFIEETCLPSPCIIWLDYADANKRGEQLEEFGKCLDKTSPWDVLRITMNANPSTLDDVWKDEYADENLDILQEELKKLTCDNIPLRHQIMRVKRFLALEKQLQQEYIPSQRTEKTKGDRIMNQKNFPRLLYYAIIAIANKRLFNTEQQFLPLLGLTYNDFVHNMLTVTGIVLEKNENVESFLKLTGIKDWELFLGNESVDWSNVKIQDIGVPELTVKEKGAIDALLPHSHEESDSIKTFKVEVEEKYKIKFEEQEIENYLKFYRYYPSFRQVWL